MLDESISTPHLSRGKNVLVIAHVEGIQILRDPLYFAGQVSGSGLPHSWILAQRLRTVQLIVHPALDLGKLQPLWCEDAQGSPSLRAESNAAEGHCDVVVAQCRGPP